MNSRETLSEWLDSTLRYAKRMGLTAKEIAAAIGKHPVVLSEARKGARNLSWDELSTIAEKVGVPLPTVGSIATTAHHRLSLQAHPEDEWSRMKAIEESFKTLDSHSQDFVISRLLNLKR